MRGIAIILMALLCAGTTYAQKRKVQSPTITRDSIIIEAQDSALIQSYAKRYNPRKALLLAAVIPGAGQVYNKKYWKLPLVYGGFYAIGFYVNQYNKLHHEYKGYLFENLESGDANHPKVRFSTQQLRTITERFRRERDFMVILMGGMYLLQIVDAHVDAHLKEFDLNPNLKVSFQPTVTQDAWVGRQTGMSMVIRF